MNYGVSVGKIRGFKLFSPRSVKLQMAALRLGHMSVGNIKLLYKMVDRISYDPKDLLDEICPICMEGKQSCLPHNKEHVKVKRPLQLVHSDLFFCEA